MREQTGNGGGGGGVVVRVSDLGSRGPCSIPGRCQQVNACLKIFTAIKLCLMLYYAFDCCFGLCYIQLLIYGTE